MKEMSFAQEFHEVVSKVEEWIEAEPLPCLSCGRPYREHTENGEHCVTEYDDTYCDPENWECYAEVCDERTARTLRERARSLGVRI